MTISIRPATREDIPAMARIDAVGFQDSPYTMQKFPERLRVKDGLGDCIEWFTGRAERYLGQPGIHSIVAVETPSEGGEEVVVGYADWRAPKEAGTEQQQPQQRGGPRSYAAYIDVEAMRRMDGEIQDLLQRTEPEFKGRKKEDMWTLDAIAVDEKHRRKGIGRKLTDWGMRAAAADGKGVWLIAGPHGVPLYTQLGFEVLGEGARGGEEQYVMILGDDTS